MPAPSTIVASIVIVAWGKRPVTEQCLASLERALGDELGTRYELVLVDNASPDDTAELFASWEDRATVVYMERNENFSGGCNAGARAASGEVLIFLNNDTEVPAGALEVLAEQAREPGVGAVGARLVYPDGTIQHGGVVWKEECGFTLPYHLFHHAPGDTPAAGAVYDLDAVTGACLAIPRELFFELGGFDDAYINGFEDVDLCIKVRVAGRRIVYRGDVEIVHHEGLTRGSGRTEADNMKVLYPRWGHLFGDDADTVATLFDAQWHPDPRPIAHAPRSPNGSMVTMEGDITSLAPDAAEARALLACVEDAGLAPAARDRQPNFYVPRLRPEDWGQLLAARGRLAHPSALGVLVPAGALARPPENAVHVLRLAAAGPEIDESVAAIWAATPALADELVAGGVPADAIDVLAPLVDAPSAGPGGAGVLALLPAQDHAACSRQLEALAPFAARARLRLLPNVADPIVAALAAERLPAAELLAPLSCERDFAQLAGECDVVVALDAGDRFERRALIAAGAGAATVTLPGAPASAWLSDAVTSSPADAGALTEAVTNALERSPERATRSVEVRRVCAPADLQDRLRALVAAAQGRLSPAAAGARRAA
jgi:GT2 family glycosyltransferase